MFRVMDAISGDSLFDFFDDVPRVKSHATEKAQTTGPFTSAPLEANGTLSSPEKNVAVENEGQNRTDRQKLVRQNQDIYSDDLPVADSLPSQGLEVGEASVEYEDDFESTPETSESNPNEFGRADTRVKDGSTTDSSAVGSYNCRQPTQMSPGQRKHTVSRTVWSGDKCIRGCYQVTKAVGRKEKHSSERGTTDRRLPGSRYRLSGKNHSKEINKTFDGKNTVHLTSNRLRKRGGDQQSAPSGPNTRLGRVKDVVDSGVSLDISSEVIAGNYDDRYLNNFSEYSVKMASRNKLLLPKVEKSGRVQLTRPGRTTGHRGRGYRGNKTSPKENRTHVSMASKYIGRSDRDPNKQQTRKPAVPIPLKSDAIYCNGELSVSVRGDRRGNPDRNKFNVTITVIHKHTKSRAMPYLSRQTRPPRKLPPCPPIDWDIVQHRATFPGFNTATDPEVNRRYLQQFGL